jgi:hypothetical protein
MTPSKPPAKISDTFKARQRLLSATRLFFCGPHGRERQLFQMAGVELEMIFDETRDEVIAVIVPRLHANRD